MDLTFLRSTSFTVREGCKAFVNFYVSEYNECGVGCRRCSTKEFTLARDIKRYINDHSTDKNGAMISLEVTDSNCDSKADIKIHNAHLSATAYSLFQKHVSNFMEIIHCKCSKDSTDDECDLEGQEDGKSCFPAKFQLDDQNRLLNPTDLPRLFCRLQISKKGRGRLSKMNRPASSSLYPFPMSHEDPYSSTSENDASFFSEQSEYDSDKASIPSGLYPFEPSKTKMNQILNLNPDAVCSVSQGSEKYVDLLPNATAYSPFGQQPMCLEDDLELQPNSIASPFPLESSKDNPKLPSY